MSQFETYLRRSPVPSEATALPPAGSPSAEFVDLPSEVARSFSARQSRTHSKTPMVLWALAGLVLFLGIVMAAGRLFSSPRSDVVGSPTALPPKSTDEQAPVAADKPPEKDGRAPPVAAPRETKIPDDGRALWASPTEGPPLELHYLPLDAQVFLAIRPAQLLEHPEGEKILAALGPQGAFYAEQLKAITGFEPGEIEQLIVGLRAAEDGPIEPSLVVRLAEPLPQSELLARWNDAENATHGAGQYYRRGPWAYYRPPDAPPSLFAVTPVEQVGDVIESGGASPPLSPQLERMLAGSDSTRDVTLLFSPYFVFGDGRKILSGAAEKLREPLFFFLGDDEIKAVALSLHLREDLFVELCVRSDLEIAPRDLAAKLETRVREVPDRFEGFVAALDVHRFGRQVVNRLPSMVRFLCRHTRVGTDRDQAILRCYQPAIAAHNLLMGLELVLAQPAGIGGAATATRPAPADSSVEALLRTNISLSFPRDTLETSLELLSQEIGVKIQIAGGDLQLEGITKNQSFGIDLRDQPAQQVLEQILRLANPDKSVKSLADPQQKLVYVIKPKEPDGPPMIIVTTRTQALKRGDRLPDAFVSKTDGKKKT